MNKNIRIKSSAVRPNFQSIDNFDASTGGLPLYQRVRDRIRAELIEGIWKPGEPLSTEVELGRLFNGAIA